MKLQLTHLRLLVSNYKDSFLFYRDLLKFDVDWGDEESGYAELNTGYLKLGLFKKELMAEVVPRIEQPSYIVNRDKIVLVFAVDNVDEVYNQVKNQNSIVVTEPQDRPDWGIRTAHFRDPDGNLIEIYSNLGIVS
ncbi:MULTISPECIES: VOC family protein [unclassified Nostoc]|uniref:VOC family protein n=1 Tax=unclassified Nostoc TaxID=2593658 RepID=UPI000DEC2E26|nr:MULTISPECIES: VOC family protein [unclassified Nostoc]MBD2506840.1 VOC family protein [Desmonostoc muscorum FACHB-395]MBD2525921.1 VOC family protein [Nostoc sp. FACHB-133]QHG15234.1 VOC family protein [Nostoc sp. ATCC 53789]RCJ23632.1 extradiol dioxygenase [Nostoc sp. ATCC 53789]